MPLTITVGGVPTVHYKHGAHAVVIAGTDPAQFAFGRVGTPRDPANGLAPLVPRNPDGSVADFVVSPLGGTPVVWLTVLDAVGDFGEGIDLVDMVSMESAALYAEVPALRHAAELAMLDAAASAQSAADIAASVGAGETAVSTTDFEAGLNALRAETSGTEQNVVWSDTLGGYPPVVPADGKFLRFVAKAPGQDPRVSYPLTLPAIWFWVQLT